MDRRDAKLTQPALMAERKGDGEISSDCIFGRANEPRHMTRCAKVIAIGPCLWQIGMAGQDDGDVHAASMLTTMLVFASRLVALSVVWNSRGPEAAVKPMARTLPPRCSLPCSGMRFV